MSRVAARSHYFGAQSAKSVVLQPDAQIVYGMSSASESKRKAARGRIAMIYAIFEAFEELFRLLKQYVDFCIASLLALLTTEPSCIIRKSSYKSFQVLKSSCSNPLFLSSQTTQIPREASSASICPSLYILHITHRLSRLRLLLLLSRLRSFFFPCSFPPIAPNKAPPIVPTPGPSNTSPKNPPAPAPMKLFFVSLLRRFLSSDLWWWWCL